MNLKTGAVRNPNTNPAEVGTLLIEFGTLSKLTRKTLYSTRPSAPWSNYTIAVRKSDSLAPEINIETGAWINPASNVSGGIDSYYEYLLKCWLLFGDKDCKRMWDASLKALNTYVADETVPRALVWHRGYEHGQTDCDALGSSRCFFCRRASARAATAAAPRNSRIRRFECGILRVSSPRRSTIRH